MEIIEHYSELYDEEQRLLNVESQIEFVRTQEIITRYLPHSPAVILDIGGGPGRYSFWLAKKGYDVHLIDLTPLHIEQAKRTSTPEKRLSSYNVGDGRDLNFEDSFADSALVMGPMYHLTEHSDRIKALTEARRVVKTGGLLFTAYISRFASILDGMSRGFLDDPEFRKIVSDDLKSGQHRNSTGNPEYFTTSYFHHPDEIRPEQEEANLEVIDILPVEGIGYFFSDFTERWQKPDGRDMILESIRTVEKDKSIIGLSPHLLAVSRKM